MSCSELGDPEALGDYISIELVENENTLIVLTTEQVTKVDLSKRDQVTVAGKWTNKSEGEDEKPFWHMQIFEDLGKLYVSQTNEDYNFTDIFELNLTDLSMVRKVNPDQGLYQVGYFFYNP